MQKENNIVEQGITDVLESNYMPYAMSVIMSRAIPEIDGFKPSHRKLLYTMFKMGLIKGSRTKSSNVVGQTMKLNPHGDIPIYETMVRLTRGNESLIVPLVDSKGNFGKVYSKDMAYAAPRYTEVKLEKVCEEIFADIDKNTVEFQDNYDSTTQEPLLLPTKFPNILVNPNQGIAVGMASNICSFNLRETCKMTIEYIKDENVNLIKYLKAPDFSTAGEIILKKKDMEKIYETGRGSFKLRAKYKYDKKNSCIDVYEIPYTTTIEAIIDKIVNLVKSSKIKEINDVRDETDIKGLKLTIDIKRNTDPELLMRRLFDRTTLMDTFSCNFNILVNSQPRVMGVREILKEWLDFRMTSLRRRIQFDIDKKSEKVELLEGLKIIILDIDRAIKIIRETKEEKKVIPNLIKGFKINENQAEYIAEIKLRNINEEYLFNRIKELDDLYEEIKILETSLKDDGKIKDIIIKDLEEVSKKYGQARKTEIIKESEIEVFEEEDFIEDYDIHLFLTEQNYFKKITQASLSQYSEQRLRDNDNVIQELDTTNKSELLMFSSKQNVYKIKAHEIEEQKASALGEYLPNLLEISDEEIIIKIIDTVDYKGHLLLIFEDGKMARITLDNYKTKTNRKKLINAFTDKNKLIHIQNFREDGDFVVIRDNDKAAIINTSLIPLIATRTTVGVRAFTLKKNSEISNVLSLEDFKAEDKERYRISKIPSTGHFLTDEDKNLNAFKK